MATEVTTTGSWGGWLGTHLFDKDKSIKRLLFPMSLIEDKRVCGNSDVASIVEEVQPVMVVHAPKAVGYRGNRCQSCGSRVGRTHVCNAREVVGNESDDMVDKRGLAARARLLAKYAARMAAKPLELEVHASPKFVFSKSGKFSETHKSGEYAGAVNVLLMPTAEPCEINVLQPWVSVVSKQQGREVMFMLRNNQVNPANFEVPVINFNLFVGQWVLMFAASVYSSGHRTRKRTVRKDDLIAPSMTIKTTVVRLEEPKLASNQFGEASNPGPFVDWLYGWGKKQDEAMREIDQRNEAKRKRVKAQNQPDRPKQYVQIDGYYFEVGADNKVVRDPGFKPVFDKLSDTQKRQLLIDINHRDRNAVNAKRHRKLGDPNAVDDRKRGADTGGEYVPPAGHLENTRVGEASNPGPPKVTGGVGAQLDYGPRGSMPIKVTNWAGGVTVSGVDYLGPLPTPTALAASWTGGLVLYNQPLDVNFGGIMSRVTRFSKMYEQYRIKQFVLEYDPNTGTAVSSADGFMPALCSYIDPDVLDDPKDNTSTNAAIQNAINQKGAEVFPAYECVSVTTDFQMMNGGWRWCSPSENGTDPHLSNFGRAVVLAANTAPDSSFDGSSVGTLYAVWSVDFRAPSGMNTLPNHGIAQATTGTTPTNVFGLVQNAPDNDGLWDTSMELQPYVSYDGTKTRFYPCQTANSVNGGVVAVPSSSAQYWILLVRAEGTHTKLVTPVLFDFVSSTVTPGVIALSPPVPELFNMSVVTSGTTTAFMAYCIIQIPLGCDPRSYIGITVANDGTTATVTQFSLELTAVNQSATVTAFQSRTVYIKNLDGTINLNKTLHATYLNDCAMSPDPLLVPPCKCVDCRNGIELSPIVVERPREKAVRYGEAKHPGPPRRQIHCAKNLDRLHELWAPDDQKKDFRRDQMVTKTKVSQQIWKKKVSNTATPSVVPPATTRVETEAKVVVPQTSPTVLRKPRRRNRNKKPVGTPAPPNQHSKEKKTTKNKGKSNKQNKQS